LDNSGFATSPEEERMRNSILLAFGLFVVVAPTAHAANMEPCNQPSVPERIDCLQKNIAVLNSSHEAVAAELRKAVADLTTKVGDLATKVGTLPTDVATLTRQVSELKGQIPKLDEVVIEWFGHGNNCMGVEGGDVHIRYFETCVDPNRNRFVVRPYHP
jgi:chaperonin cofactor prefoldin